MYSKWWNVVVSENCALAWSLRFHEIMRVVASMRSNIFLFSLVLVKFIQNLHFKISKYLNSNLGKYPGWFSDFFCNVAVTTACTYILNQKNNRYDMKHLNLKIFEHIIFSPLKLGLFILIFSTMLSVCVFVFVVVSFVYE